MTDQTGQPAAAALLNISDDNHLLRLFLEFVEPDLDQFMVGQGRIHSLNQRIGNSFLTDEYNGLKSMRQSPEVFLLEAGKRHYILHSRHRI